MAVGGSGSRVAVAWVAVTCVLVGGALAYVLAGRQGSLGVSDRMSLISMVAALLALVLALIGWLATRSGAHEDEAAAVARLVREVRSVGEPQWMHSLGGDLKAIDVTFSFRPYAHARAAALPPTPAGQLERVVEDYRAVRPRRLVITGEPGAGKTVLARKLVMELNKARGESEPVAVLVALADWDTREGLGDWIARHLERDFGMPRRSARRVVRGRRVLPVLDGLDEMDAAEVAAEDSRARAALEALARYQDGTDPAPLVLTCRTRRYDELEADGSHILDAARIEIDPVDPEQAVRFLEQRGAARRPAAWQPVLDELRNAPSGTLARDLSTPWRLMLTATVYERRGDPGDLLRAATGPDGSVAELLLGRFIGAAADNAPGEAGRYEERLIHERLHQLALTLGADGADETDLVLLRLADRVRGALRPTVLVGLVALAILPALVLARWDSYVDELFLAGAVLFLTCYLLYWELRESGGIFSPSFSAMATPPLGGPLWRLGLRRMWHARSVWTYAVLAMLVFSLWVALPEAWGGLGDPWVLWLTGGFMAVVVGLGVITQLDSTAVGPSGPIRTGWYLIALATLLLSSGQMVSGHIGLGDLIFTDGLLAAALTGMQDWIGYHIYRIRHPRLGLRFQAFLDWSVTAGLLRTSGVAYQFRHREFQEWVVRNPEPVRRP
ncbi:NACHT domain-containing protein [Streptomyces cupreus]|uniref:NACHT domain-containing protein n=1 Tax=Streptomyces cupreus TaxID=2759956 RepID=A0A7X1J8U5_9ACTN|nr:NACHT domain-containing protein [Streptomyces cupreus]MBC2903792.1 NACHT domain-containing protein [Streptomyces cupreus]